MNWKRTWAIFHKEAIHIRRDPISLLQVILLPITLMLLYGYALTFDIKHVRLAIYDQEQSRRSENFINEFRGNQYFKLVCWVSSHRELVDLLEHRVIQAGVVLPYDFSWSYQTGKSAQVQVLLDGTDSNTANIVLGYLQTVAANYNGKLLAERYWPQGMTRLETPLDPQMRFWFNEDLESRNYIVPGLIAVIMTVVGALLTALTVVREVERGSMEGLMATPLKKAELLLGKLGPYFIIGMVDMAIVLAMGKFLFDVPFRGSVLLLVGLSSIFLLATLAQGLLISVSAENQLQAFQMAMLTTFLPAFLLSGFVFAIYLMPWPLRLVSLVVPARYLVTIAKGICLKGVGMRVLWPHTLMLVGAAAFFLVLALRKFQKKLK